MIRFLTVIALSLLTLPKGFASDDEILSPRSGVPAGRVQDEQARWLQEAKEFIAELDKAEASSEDKLLRMFLASKPDLTPNVVECVKWFKEFRADLKLVAKEEQLYTREMETLWNFVSKNGCWTATKQAKAGDLWGTMTNATDIIRLIRGLLGRANY